MAKPNKKKDQVQFEYNNPETVFTDIAEISLRDDVVSISFAVRDKKGEKANVSHRVFLTVPHFLRFTDACEGLSKKIKDSIEELRQTNIEEKE